MFLHGASSLFLDRCGIALALNKLSQYLDESQVTPLFLFFVPDALNDRHTEVRRCMLDAALSALNTHGKVLHASLLKHLLFIFPVNRRMILCLCDVFIALPALCPGQRELPAAGV